jgi:hypothetical protein
MPRVTLRPTIPEDLPFLIGEPLPYRIRAITAVLTTDDKREGTDDGGQKDSCPFSAVCPLSSDKVIGIGGIAFPPDGPVWAFVQQAPDAKKYPVAFHRAGLMAMKMIRESGVMEVVATADADNEAAVRWLRRLGFEAGAAQPIEGKLLFTLKLESDAMRPL